MSVLDIKNKLATFKSIIIAKTHNRDLNNSGDNLSTATMGSLEINNIDASSDTQSIERLGLDGLLQASPLENADIKATHTEPGALAGPLIEFMDQIEKKFHEGVYDAQAMPIIEDYLEELRETALIQAKRFELNSKRISDAKEAHTAAFNAVAGVRRDRAQVIETEYQTMQQEWLQSQLQKKEVEDTKKEERKAQKIEREKSKTQRKLISIERKRESRERYDAIRRDKQTQRSIRAQERHALLTLNAQRKAAQRAQKAENAQAMHELKMKERIQDIEEARMRAQAKQQEETARLEKIKADIETKKQSEAERMLSLQRKLVEERKAAAIAESEQMVLEMERIKLASQLKDEIASISDDKDPLEKDVEEIVNVSESESDSSETVVNDEPLVDGKGLSSEESLNEEARKDEEAELAEGKVEDEITN